MKKLLFILFLLSAHFINAQGTTTSSIEGIITDAAGKPLQDVTVFAVHTPSGSNFGVISNAKGYYFIPNMRVGGPYKISYSYIGFKEQIFENVTLGLGVGKTLNIVMDEDNFELDEVVLSTRKSVTSSSKTGASTNLKRDKIDALPTINRSINDFTRLTPQSNGTAFAGTNNRFNNYTIDGNIYNNNFGLGSGQFAGSNPISLDAIEEVQVNLAPYDVRLSGFSGASVNAITKSGTNKFVGTTYYLMRNDQMTGDKIGESQLNIDKSKTQIQGISLGGPLVKDKLFFFINYENETDFVPSFQKRALRPGETPNQTTISRVPAERLDFVRSKMDELYGYQTGAYEGYNFESVQDRLNVRLDWNISDKHKFMVRYNLYTSSGDVPVNPNSIRYIQTRYNNTSRAGIEAMNFRNSNYTNDRTVSSLVGELNSSFSSKLSNQLNIGYTSITDPKRGIPGGQVFPFIEVLEPDSSGNLLYYMTMGNELFSVGNLLENNVFNVTNNTTYYLDTHKITAGVNYERFTFDNAFNPAFNGFYRFNSYQSFEDAIINQIPGVVPDAFAKGYALDGSTTPPTDEVQFSQFGVYVQDQWNVNKDLKLTFGLRMDLPTYNSDLPRNTLLDQLIADRNDPSSPRYIEGGWQGFEGPDGNFFLPDVTQFPRVRPLWSPRFGFNWDLFGQGKTIFRGGTGVFTGRIPFVWLSNQVNGSGVIRGGLGYEGADVNAANGFGPNWVFDPSNSFGNPENPDQTLANELNLTDRNFKLPQVWRTNIAIDQELLWGIKGTMEFIFSRDIYTPIAYNAVLREPTNFFNGPDPRGYWAGNNYSNDPAFRNIFLLTNAKDKADYYSTTIQLSKDFESGFSVFGAYTRSEARDLDTAGGSQAVSLWTNTVQQDRNRPELSFANHDIPNRVIGGVTYRTENTTLSLFYQGSESGRFSYTYSGNFGDSSNRLMYIPNDASELYFQQFSVGGVTYTQDMQREMLEDYINQDKYLRNNRGKIAERNGALMPWLNTVDLRLTQDIHISKKHGQKLQISMDILNFGNLLDSDWSVRKVPVQRNILNYRQTVTLPSGEIHPIYRLNTIPGTTEFPTKTYRDSNFISDTWRMQFGVRYLFN
ncbi:MAG: TonB-dependent receptor domain-containing protein [Flavobacterium sp.]